MSRAKAFLEDLEPVKEASATPKSFADLKKGDKVYLSIAPNAVQTITDVKRLGKTTIQIQITSKSGPAWYKQNQVLARTFEGK